MAALSWSLIICTLLASLARADDVGFAPEALTSSSLPTSTSQPTSPPASTPSNPTVPPTPPSTTPPTTPSTLPTTPSTSPTTPSTPLTTPSIPPTTSTSVPPTTPAPPKPPSPAPPVPGTWHVDYDASNTSCILLKMAAVIEISYETTKNITNTGQLIIWENAVADGECGSVTQNVTLKWSSVVNSTTEKNQSIKFVFNKNGTKFDLDEVVLNIVMDNQTFPDSKDTNKTLFHVKKDFVTSVGNSYKCDKTQTFNLTQSNSNKTEGNIQISSLQLQAFHNVTGAKQFAEAVDCEPYETPDIVPIAVGCALAALIVIVLITYLIGRRRNQARGYLSMFTENKREADYIPMRNLSCFQ